MNPYPHLYADRPLAFTERQTVYTVDYVRVRRSAGLSAFTECVLEPELAVEIVAGVPISADGLTWWPVLAEHHRGWIAESAPDGAPLLAATSIETQRQVIYQEAERLDLPPALAMAVFAVESAPADIPAPHLVLNFEPHILGDYLFTHVTGAQARFFARFGYGSPPWTNQRWRTDDGVWRSLGSGQHNERCAIDLACRLFGREAALRATSMGPGQIMGFNYEQMGYSSAAAMFDDWRANHLAAVRGFFRYLEWAELLHAIRAQDWKTFAIGYNGIGNARTYVEKLTVAVAFAKKEQV